MQGEGEGSAEAWASFLLALAALYNLLWGGVVVLAPAWCLGLVGLGADASRPLAQCIGMLVGVYGVAYWIAASDPGRYWPLVLVGLLGKVLGPLGGIWAVARGDLPAAILVVNVMNDLIWWGPFAWILWCARAGRFGRSAAPGGEGLYPSLIGPRFADLGPQLQRFHSARSPIEVAGTFAVVRGSGALRNWIADREGFPRSVDSIDVRLRVRQEGDREIWSRRFGDRTLESSQWRSAGLLAERLGFVTLLMRPRAESGQLVIESVRSRAFGIPLPPFFAPRVFATGVDTDRGMRISVSLQLAPLGRLVEYSGVVSIREPSKPT